MNIVIEQGRVICPQQGLDQITNVYIQDGKIACLGEPKDAFKPDKIIKAKDCLVIPGLVDLYGYYKNKNGDICYQEALVAAQNGFTTLCCAPHGHTPTDSPISAKKIVEATHPIDILPIGALTQGLSGQVIADLTALNEAGCPAFTQDLSPIQDLNILRNCYHYAASFDLKVIIFALEPSLANGHIHEGVVSAQTGLSGIPVTAETIAMAQHLHLIEETGVSAHFSHVTSAKGVELIHQAQQMGLNVTADCSMNHLHLTEVDVASLNPNTYVMPPLRSTQDLTGLRKGLTDGTLCAITSSHQPLPKLAKTMPFSQATPGISSIETFFSLGLHLVNQGVMNMNTFIKAVTSGPLQALNLSLTCFETGAQADICVIDEKAYWTVEEASLKSEGRNTPFIGWELPGKVKATIKNGELI